MKPFIDDASSSRMARLGPLALLPAAASMLLAFSAPAQNLFVGCGNLDTYTITPSGAKSVFNSIGQPLPYQLAFDQAGDLFETDENQTLSEFLNVHNVLQTTPITIATGLSDPQGLAFDSLGNLFVACGSKIIKFQNNGTLSSTPTTFASGLTGAVVLAFDSTGDLFALGNNPGYEFLYHGGINSGLSSTPTTIPGSDLSSVTALAFDSAGDLYTCVQNESLGEIVVYKTPNSGGTLKWSQETLFASLSAGFGIADGLAFDAAGDLFMTALDNSDVVEFVNNQGTLSATPKVFVSGLEYPFGIAFQPAGADCASVPTSVVNWWPGNGNTSDIISGDTAIWKSSAPASPYVDGEVEESFNFDGSHFLATSDVYNNPQTFTEECWFKTTTATGGVLMGFSQDQSDTGGGFDRMVFMLNNGTLHYGIWTGHATTADSTASYNDGNWHHMAATQSPSAGMTLYVDGSPVASNAGGTAPENYNGYWRIGEDNMNNWPNVPSSLNFTGAIDEATIYNTALSASQVMSIYQAGANGKCCCIQGCTVSKTGNTVVVTWKGCGILLGSSSVSGPLTPIPNASSPYTPPAGNMTGFFQVLCP